MAIQREIWADEIVRALWAPNSFLNYALDATPWVTEGGKFHIPQAGAATGIVENATVFPIAVEERTDADLDFTADNFFVKPVRLGKAEEYELSYSKLQSVTSENRANLFDRVAQKVLYRWVTASTGGAVAPQARTTGAARASALKYATTGTRKAMTLLDIRKMAEAMDEDNVPEEGRLAMVPPAMYYDVFNEDGLLRRDVAGELNVKQGKVSELFGFNFMKRSGGLRYTNAGTPVARDTTAAGAATDNGAAIFWHPAFVYIGKGDVEVFNDERSATMYGDVISMLVRVGAAKKRADAKGVRVLVEDLGV